MVLTSFLRDCKVVACSPDAVAAQTDLDGTVIDMGAEGGFNAVAFIAYLGDVAATSAIELQCQGSDAANGSSPSLEATSGTKTAGASDCDDKFVILDVIKPAKRYVFSRLKRGTANAAVNSVVAVLYKANNLPVVQPADVVQSALAIIR